MPRIPKLLWTKKNATLNPELQEKIEIYLNHLAQGGESEAFEPTAVLNLAGELDSNPGLAELIFQKVLSQPNQQLFRLLSDLVKQVTSKPVQKSIKRALYLLKQKGMDLPFDIEKKEGGGGILKAMDPVQVTGYLSEFDPARNRMLAMLIPKGPKGKLFVFALVDPEGSLGSLTALEVNKKGAKEILGELEEHSGHSFLEADPGQVAFILKEAHDRKSILSREDEGIYGAILTLLSSLKTINPFPIIRSLFPLDQEGSEAPLDINRLMAIPDMSYYLPADELIEPYRKAIQEAQDGILILNNIQKREQINEIVRRASQAIFQGPVKTGLLRYLEEISYLYYLKGQLEEAKILFSAAQFLEDQKELIKPEGEAFLIRLTEKALWGERMVENEGSPIQYEEQSPGGIIIPPWVKK
jgi:hypothetical protein